MTKIASLKIAYWHKIKRAKRIVSLSKRQETVHVRDRRVVIGINSNASPRRREQDDESADTDVGVDDISEDAVGEMSEEIATECRADARGTNDGRHLSLGDVYRHAVQVLAQCVRVILEHDALDVDALVVVGQRGSEAVLSVLVLGAVNLMQGDDTFNNIFVSILAHNV